jgi:hypothetical protein
MTIVRLLAATLAASALLPAGARACSLSPFPVVRDGIHLIGTATPDTLPAGDGGVEYRLERGDTARAVYGQVVRVERVGGPDAAELPPGTDRVVLVPWGYDAACLRTLWTMSARWAAPGERGLFTASLRPRERWVDGLPTFDEFSVYHSPYPGGLADHLPADSLMTVDQAFEFLQHLPLWEDIEADGERATRPILDWARANPALARLTPAADIVQSAVHDARAARVSRMDAPLAGTYRLAVTVDGSAPRVFYVRTGAAPAEEWPHPWLQEERPPLDAPVRGHTLTVAWAAAEDALPVEMGPQFGGGQAFFTVLTEPDTVQADRRVWRGDLSVYLVLAAFRGDTVLARVEREEHARMMRRVEADLDLPAPTADARFVTRADGSVSLEQRVVVGEGTVIEIRGERISRATVATGC